MMQSDSQVTSRSNNDGNTSGQPAWMQAGYATEAALDLIRENKAGGLGVPFSAFQFTNTEPYHKYRSADGDPKTIEVLVSGDDWGEADAMIAKFDADDWIQRGLWLKRWNVKREERKTIKAAFYLQTSMLDGKKYKTVSAHQAVLDYCAPGAKTKLVCDHINGDGLDNRRCNLRLATRSENSMNCRPAVSIGKDQEQNSVAQDSVVVGLPQDLLAVVQRFHAEYEPFTRQSNNNTWSFSEDGATVMLTCYMGRRGKKPSRIIVRLDKQDWDAFGLERFTWYATATAGDKAIVRTHIRRRSDGKDTNANLKSVLMGKAGSGEHIKLRDENDWLNYTRANLPDLTEHGAMPVAAVPAAVRESIADEPQSALALQARRTRARVQQAEGAIAVTASEAAITNGESVEIVAARAVALVRDSLAAQVRADAEAQRSALLAEVRQMLPREQPVAAPEPKRSWWQRLWGLNSSSVI